MARYLVTGCAGFVGSHLAERLLDEGHEVIVIDKNPQALARLGPNFKGRTVEGVGFDRDVLIEAGIEEADAFAATSTSDNARRMAKLTRKASPPLNIS